MTPSWNELWAEAKRSDTTIARLAEIGTTMLHGINLNAAYDAETMSQMWETLYLARVQWIAYRIEFLNIAASIKLRAQHDTLTGRKWTDPPRVNPYADNAGKFGPLRAEDYQTSYQDHVVTDMGAGVSVQHGDRVIPLQSTEVTTQSIEMVHCSDHEPHPPHANGDGWCVG